MNQKDYKEIAWITKENYFSFRNSKLYDCFVKELANYFEREDIERATGITHRKVKLEHYNKENERFNKQQFLKDCGVSE